MPDQLAHHFAEIMDGQDARRHAEEAQRTRTRELDNLMDEQEHLELIALTDQIEQGLCDMAKLLRAAGFYIPLIENIKRDDETSVTFICVGEQYCLSGSPSFRSIPARLNLEGRGASARDTGERGWQQIWHRGLLPGPDGDAILARQTMDYFFEKATENLCPAARARLDAFLHGSAPTAPQAQP